MSDPRPKKFKIIINPKAGQGKSNKWFVRDVLPILMAAGTNVVNGDMAPAPKPGEDTNDRSAYHITTIAREAIRIAKEMKLNGRFDAVLNVGGDGGIHEISQGLTRRKDGVDGRDALEEVAIATIPAGTVPVESS